MCLKKLVLEAKAMGIWDSEKGGWEPWDPLGEKPYLEGSTGGNRVYNRNCRRVKKLIPIIMMKALGPLTVRRRFDRR